MTRLRITKGTGSSLYTMCDKHLIIYTHKCPHCTDSAVVIDEQVIEPIELVEQPAETEAPVSAPEIVKPTEAVE